MTVSTKSRPKQMAAIEAAIADFVGEPAVSDPLLSPLLASIQADSQVHPSEYLDETTVPYGGE